MTDTVKKIFHSIALIAPFFIAIVVINNVSDKYGFLQGEYDPLWYIIPIMACVPIFLKGKHKKWW